MSKFLQISLPGLFVVVFLTACSNKNEESDIPLTEVPGSVINIVQNTLPGISLKEAEKKLKDDQLVYELEGEMLNGKAYEIEITESGTIIKIELED